MGAFVLLLPLSAAAQATPIGQVKTVVGVAEVLRAGQVIVAKVGLPLFESDLVRTGADGRLGITLRDETRLAFGPGTQLMLAKFAFEPAEEKLGLTVRLIRGTLSFISGRISKLSPASVTIETPTSVIGVRGTHIALKVD